VLLLSQSLFDQEQIPFVFGGDGATFLVPSERLPEVKLALQKLMALAQVQFGFELRVGTIPVSEVHSASQKILVGKLLLNPLSAIACVKGGGLNWAEKQIKGRPEIYCVELSSDQIDVPKELSCRWKPIRSKKGSVLSILIQPKTSDLSHLAKLTSQIEEICGGRIENSNPVNTRGLSHKGFWKAILDEMKLHKSFSARLVKRVLATAVAVLAFKFRIPMPFDSSGYKAQLQAHSDYRKFDDVLRMILDCSKVETNSIRKLLEESHKAGEIYYGIHESSHALMTCLVQSMHPGRHIHFIDGSDGGYAVAAKQLKSQILNS
jgi:hypothetical protein